MRDQLINDINNELKNTDIYRELQNDNPRIALPNFKELNKKNIFEYNTT